jgi:DNA repair protein RecN (Recombination protein N)
MLRFLAVRHLAVIDRLEVEFEPGLNVLTGETGAGKTMVVEAIDLLVGGRASADLVRTGEDLATVQAIFERSDGDDVIVRREVSAQGRSRGFIDDALATTAALRDLGSRHVDLHGQHEHQALLDPSEHVELLDAFAGHDEHVRNVGEHFAAWRAAATALDRTQLGEREKRARIEIASFQLQEIDRVATADGEDEQLLAERLVLANADRLGRLCAEAYTALYEGDLAALTSLAVVWRRVGELAELDPRFGPYLDQRDDLKSRLEDLAFFLRSYGADINASPDRLQVVEDRLASIERLKKKYGPTLADVMARQAALREDLAALDANDERAARLERQAGEAREAFVHAARDLSSARQTAARSIGRALVEALGELAMPKSRVDIRVTSVEGDLQKWTARGTDDVEFFLSPNPGEEVRPLARIASGGELSRVMLALRTLAVPGKADGIDVPGRTLVFDEVDAGIGGAAADAVGARLQALARRHQVLCITHLPQIAARAGTHFQIAKQVTAGRTITVVSKLDSSGREQEIARMIAGAQVSPQVLASAREMITNRQASERRSKSESERPVIAKVKGKRSGA